MAQQGVEAIEIRALSWNLYHGRDFPPDRGLLTLRSRLLRRSERNDTHIQVNRDLSDEFIELISSWDWDVALLQECPPRWRAPLAKSCGAESHQSLTSRNSLAPVRRLLTALNPDLISSNEGGSNLLLVRPSAGEIVERRELVLEPGPTPERRTMAYVRLESGLCVAGLHASAHEPHRIDAHGEALRAAESATGWAGERPLILGGDFNLRPRTSDVFAELERRFGLRAPTPDRIDHLLARGLEVTSPARAAPSEEREARDSSGLAIRLSDHAPVFATFRLPGESQAGAAARG